MRWPRADSLPALIVKVDPLLLKVIYYSFNSTIQCFRFGRASILSLIELLRDSFVCPGKAALIDALLVLTGLNKYADCLNKFSKPSNTEDLWTGFLFSLAHG